jgi:hypothetical protein
METRCRDPEIYRRYEKNSGMFPVPYSIENAAVRILSLLQPKYPSDYSRLETFAEMPANSGLFAITSRLHVLNSKSLLAETAKVSSEGLRYSRFHETSIGDSFDIHCAVAE